MISGFVSAIAVAIRAAAGCARVFFAVVLLCGGVAHAQDLAPWRGGATPPLELNDLNGRAHRLADYRGKVVLINFWATWCEPCRDEMPSIQKLKTRLAGKPFEVIAVNVGESEPRIADFLARVPLDFVVLRDHSSAVMKSWGVKLLPASFIVAPDGRIRYSHIGEFNWADERAVSAVTRLLR